MIVCLGEFAWDAACLLHGVQARPRFGHLAEHQAAGRAGAARLASTPSQQNTFTGKLTEPMLDAVFARAAQIAGDGVMVPRRYGEGRTQAEFPVAQTAGERGTHRQYGANREPIFRVAPLFRREPDS